MKKASDTKLTLQSEWKDFSGLPFVFACWTANRVLENNFVEEFNQALSLGVSNIDKVVEKFNDTGPITGDILQKYLTENIDYQLNEEKKKRT